MDLVVPSRRRATDLDFLDIVAADHLEVALWAGRRLGLGARFRIGQALGLGGRSSASCSATRASRSATGIW
jgi:hypothetical protein